jgi:hypothetical protein
MAASAGLAALAGCGAGALAPQSNQPIAAFQGTVHGGNQPVQGSYVGIYATTSAGYGGTVTPIANTTTDGNGNFNFATAPSCPAGQFAYMLATGGNPGLTAGTNNQAIVLMAPLGACSGLSALSFVTINEVTTVAAAYALSGFLPAGGAGITYSAITGGGAIPGVTTSSTNVQGLTDAFANAAAILNLSTGLANTSTPSGGAVPQGTIHAIADILQNCVNSTGAGSTSCTGTTGSLTAATPPTGSGIATPVNSLQAALDIAQYPGNNVGGLFGLLSTSPAFATGLTSAPNDWTVGIVYTNTTLSGALSLAIDAADNVWVGGSINADIMEFSPQGVMLSPAPSGTAPSSHAAGPQGGWGPTIYQNPTGSGYGDNFRNIAFDPSGNVWFSDGTASGSNLGVYEYTPAGTPTAPTQGTLTERSYAAVDTNTNNYTIASDKYGNIFTVSYKKSTCATTTKACNLVELVPTTYTPYQTFGTGLYTDYSPDVNGSRGLALDTNTGNIWVTDIGSSTVTLFQATLNNGTVAGASAAGKVITLGSPTDASYGVAVDKSANAWVVMTTSSGLYEVNSSGTVVGPEITGGGLSSPAYLVIDGNDNLFIASNLGSTATTSSVVEYSPSFKTTGGFLSPNVGFSPGATYTASGGLTGGTLYQANYIAVDRSGALWSFSTGTGTAPSLSNLVQILGVAAPTNPVLAFGQYGVKP